MLEVTDLHFSYGSRRIFSNVSFRIKPGTLCALFGPNGSGKSTLIKCCLKLLKAGGSVAVNGEDVSRLSAAALARRVAYVPQDHAPPFPFLAGEVVLMGRAPHFGLSFGAGREDLKIAADAMARLGIEQLADRAYNRLSGGQRQLVLIARALAQDTPLILLDEPTSSLDFKNQLLIWNVLRDIAAAGKTVFACVHDPNHVAWFCDAVVVMNEGAVAAVGRPDRVLNADTLNALYGNICASGSVAGAAVIYPQSAGNLTAVSLRPADGPAFSEPETAKPAAQR